MPSIFDNVSASDAIPITFVTKSNWEQIRETLPAHARQFAQANGFAAKPGQYLALPAPDGSLAQVLFGLDDEASRSRDPFRPGSLPGLLPSGLYRFANASHD